MITSLKNDQIFVFGSNLGGIHTGGAAKQAKEQFGAIEGHGEGYQGQSYAFPTLTSLYQKRPMVRLKQSVKKLYECCEKYPHKQFLMTSVGTGIAGYEIEFMKSIFAKPYPRNLVMPQEWK